METITEDYVSFETAKLLKEKGFNGISIISEYDEEAERNYINELKENHLPFSSDDPKLKEFRYTIPTLQTACKWLRLKYKIYIQAFAPLYDMDCAELGVTYNVVITNLANQCLAFDTPLDDIRYNSPEEAYEAAIKYCLENLI